MRARWAGAALVFAAVLGCAAYLPPPPTYYAPNSRIDLVYAVVDQGVLHIDDHHRNTGDKAFYEGHYYSEKSVGPALLALPAYLLFRGLVAVPPIGDALEDPALQARYDRLVRAHADEPDVRTAHSALYHGVAVTFVTLLAGAVPSSLVAVLVLLFALDLGVRFLPAVIGALAYGLATVAFPFTNVLYQHQLGALFLFGAWYLLWRSGRDAPRAPGGAAPRWWVPAAGLLLGFGVITEFSIALVIPVLAVWAWRHLPDRRQLLWAAIAAVPPVAVQVAYDVAVFDHLLPVGYRYTAFARVHARGFLGLTGPTWERLWGITGSPYRGLFFLSPYLLLALPGWWLQWRERWAGRATVTVSVVVVLVLLTYNASYEVWDGGASIGPRHLVPAVPFLALAATVALERAGRRWLTTVGAGLLVVVSLLGVWAQSLVAFPTSGIDNPLLDHALPRLADGDLRVTLGSLVGLPPWLSLLPLVVLVGAVLVLAVRWDRRVSGSAGRRGSPAAA